MAKTQLVHVDGQVKGRAMIVFCARRDLKETYARFHRRAPTLKRDHRSAYYRVVELIKNPVSGGHYVRFVWGV